MPLLVLAFASRYQLEHPLTPDSLVFFPGNERHGIWSAKQLMTVVPPTWAPGYPVEREQNPTARAAPERRTAETKKVSTPGQRQPESKVTRPRTSASRSEARIAPKGT